MKKLDFWLLAALGVGIGFGIKKLIVKAFALDFKGKVVLVTGGSRGLGLVLCRYLAKEGAKLAICARDKNELQLACQELLSQGGEVFSYVCDITDRNQIKTLVAKIEKKQGPIDVLINNAGAIKVGSFECMTHEDFEEGMNTHFWGPLNLILAVFPGMRKRKTGHIVNISSIGGKVCIPHLVPYGASKFALTGLSEGLRAELAKNGIKVTTVCPGLMRTGSPPNAYFKGKHQKEYAWFALGDSMPGLSASAERAARRIICGIKNGEGEVVITMAAKLAVWLHGLFPEATSNFLTIVNRLLPSSKGTNKVSKKGKDCASKIPSWIRKQSDIISRRNNELFD